MKNDIIQGIRNVLYLGIDGIGILNFFNLEIETKPIKDKTICDIRNRFELERDNYYKPVRVGIFYSNNYIEYESNCDRDKTLSNEEYLNKIKPIFKRCYHSKSASMEVVLYDNSDEIIEELFDSPQIVYISF